MGYSFFLHTNHWFTRRGKMDHKEWDPKAHQSRTSSSTCIGRLGRAWPAKLQPLMGMMKSYGKIFCDVWWTNNYFPQIAKSWSTATLKSCPWESFPMAIFQICFWCTWPTVEPCPMNRVPDPHFTQWPHPGRVAYVSIASRPTACVQSAVVWGQKFMMPKILDDLERLIMGNVLTSLFRL